VQGLIAAATGVMLAAAVSQPAHASTTASCQKRFTVAMAERAARAVYAGHREVDAGDRASLARELRCQRNVGARPFVRDYYRAERRAHADRVLESRMSPAYVSDYDDSGRHCCGVYATYGVAVCGSGGGPCVPQGTRILFEYGDRRVTAVADDHGPYVGGREFDLNMNTAGALGFSGLGTVRYLILGR